ncbi:MAG TPA: tripartite tricarboxylate transporter substrate binding protein [Eoetvoesiella sp.]
MSTLKRILRRAIVRALPLLGTIFLPALAAAQVYPAAPIKLVVPFSGGGGTDAVARVVAQSLAETIGQPVIVENRPGAAGALGTINVVRSRADGYTLLLGSNGPIAINPSLDPKLGYEPIRDLVAVSGIASVPFLLVANTDFPANNIEELIKIAKNKPGTVNFASPGTGTTNHLVGELLKTMTHIDMVHIPYKGAAPAMNDVASGVVQIMSGDINTLLPMIDSGRIKPVAVTGAKRSRLVSKVPTVAESGVPGFEANGWFGLFAPAGTPPEILSKLSDAMAIVLKNPDVVSRIDALGGTPLLLSGKAFEDFSEKERAKWKEVIDAHNIMAGG